MLALANYYVNTFSLVYGNLFCNFLSSFPVCIPEGTEIDESLKVSDEAALYSAADYSYVELTDIPKNYKELSTDSRTEFLLILFSIVIIIIYLV